MEDHPFLVLLVEDNAANARLIQEMSHATATLRFELTHEEDAPLIEVEAPTKAGDCLLLEIQGRVCSRSTGAAGPRSLSPFQSKSEQSHTEKKGDQPTDFDRRR